MKAARSRFREKRAITWALLSSIIALIFVGTVYNSHPEYMTSMRAISNEIDPSQEYPPEIWAAPPQQSTFSPEDIRKQLTTQEINDLTSLCARCLYHTLTHSVSSRDLGYHTFVATGDIPDMWLRDSAVQMAIYLPRIQKHPFIQRIIEGTLRTQSFFITQDPYANAFKDHYRHPTDPSLSKNERILGRGGWVATRNYEMDSGAYFFNFLWNYYTTPGVVLPQNFLSEPLIITAVTLMLNTWITEQHHETKSSYKYSELGRNGRGSKTKYTGMSFSAYRPSDDVSTFGYSIPNNIYGAGALQRILSLNRRIWKNDEIHAKATTLLSDIEKGIQKYGIIEVEPGTKVYAYEVDGMGQSLHDFDDANVPSLLSIPLLGWDKYDEKIYQATRKRLLDPKFNKFYFKTSLQTENNTSLNTNTVVDTSGVVSQIHIEGIGSPHTPEGNVWPLAMMVQALTSTNISEQVSILKALIHLQCGNGLMHESVKADDIQTCTRPIFEWANAMLVTVVEKLLEEDCDVHAEKYRMKEIRERESLDQSALPVNGEVDDPLYYENLQSYVLYDRSIEEMEAENEEKISDEY